MVQVLAVLAAQPQVVVAHPGAADLGVVRVRSACIVSQCEGCRTGASHGVGRPRFEVYSPRRAIFGSSLHIASGWRTRTCRRREGSCERQHRCKHSGVDHADVGGRSLRSCRAGRPECHASDRGTSVSAARLAVSVSRCGGVVCCRAVRCTDGGGEEEYASVKCGDGRRTMPCVVRVESVVVTDRVQRGQVTSRSSAVQSGSQTTQRGDCVRAGSPAGRTGQIVRFEHKVRLLRTPGGGAAAWQPGALIVPRRGGKMGGSTTGNQSDRPSNGVRQSGREGARSVRMESPAAAVNKAQQQVEGVTTLAGAEAAAVAAVTAVSCNQAHPDADAAGCRSVRAGGGRGRDEGRESGQLGRSLPSHSGKGDAVHKVDEGTRAEDGSGDTPPSIRVKNHDKGPQGHGKLRDSALAPFCPLAVRVGGNDRSVSVAQSNLLIH